MKKKSLKKHRVLIRFTEDEYSLVKENASKCRLFIQNYFRMLIRGIRPTEKPGDEFYELCHDLKKISVNLMQIAYKGELTHISETAVMQKVADGFNSHCTKILKLMLMFDQQ